MGSRRRRASSGARCDGEASEPPPPRPPPPKAKLSGPPGSWGGTGAAPSCPPNKEPPDSTLLRSVPTRRLFFTPAKCSQVSRAQVSLRMRRPERTFKTQRLKVLELVIKRGRRRPLVGDMSSHHCFPKNKIKTSICQALTMCRALGEASHVIGTTSGGDGEVAGARRSAWACVGLTALSRPKGLRVSGRRPGLACTPPAQAG